MPPDVKISTAARLEALDERTKTTDLNVAEVLHLLKGYNNTPGLTHEFAVMKADMAQVKATLSSQECPWYGKVHLGQAVHVATEEAAEKQQVKDVEASKRKEDRLWRYIGSPIISIGTGFILWFLFTILPELLKLRPEGVVK